MNLHNEIMNIPCRYTKEVAWNADYSQKVKAAYEEGHHDARHAAAELSLQAEQDRLDAERYKKLQRWMSSNVQEGWNEVERMGAICAYATWEDMDAYLDELPVCNFGLCHSIK